MPTAPRIRPAQNDLATVAVKTRKFFVYLVQKTELDTLRSGFVSLNFALFGIFFGAALTHALTAHVLPPDDSLRPWFWIGALFGGVLTVYFGCCARREYTTACSLIDEIKTTQVETDVEYELREKVKTNQAAS